MEIRNCPHPAKRRTLHGNEALCSKCDRARRVRFCHGCGAKPEEIKRRRGGDRLRSVEGREYCNPCRAKLKREALARAEWYRSQGWWP